MHHPARPTRQHHHRTRATRPTRIPIPHRRPARARIPVIAAPVAIAVIPPIAVTIMVMPTVIIPPITATIIARTIVPSETRPRTRPRRTIRTTRRRHIAGSQKQGRHQRQEEGGRFHDVYRRPTTATSSCPRPPLAPIPPEKLFPIHPKNHPTRRKGVSAAFV